MSKNELFEGFCMGMPLSLEGLLWVLQICFCVFFIMLLFKLWKVSNVVIQTCKAIMEYIEKKRNDTDIDI